MPIAGILTSKLKCGTIRLAHPPVARAPRAYRYYSPAGRPRLALNAKEHMTATIVAKNLEAVQVLLLIATILFLIVTISSLAKRAVSQGLIAVALGLLTLALLWFS
jgi:hypothetical protein